MLFKILPAAIVAAVVGSFAAQAQTLAQIGGPAELPPAGYKGAQFIDSRGCVFMNASFSGAAQWVPRVNSSRKVLCGMPPTFGPKPVIDVAEDNAPMVAPVAIAEAAPAPKVQREVAPMRTVASNMIADAAPLALPVVAPSVTPEMPAARAPSSQSYETVAGNGPSNGQIGCYSSAPVPEVVRLRNGGTAVVCTTGDGTLTGWRPPIYPRNAGVGAALHDPVEVVRGGHVNHSGTDYATADVEETPAIPAGYKAAWKDGRLNTKRAVGSAEGQLAQDQVWTKKVPAQLVADVAKNKAKRKAKVQAGNVTVSTMNAATAPVAAKGGSYVQVGTFGVAANAAGAAQRLQALGLPVAKSKLHKGGKDLQIVMAGPFGSVAEAQAALSMARQAGFSDAILR
jgi:hypothetical protein